MSLPERFGLCSAENLLPEVSPNLEKLGGPQWQYVRAYNNAGQRGWRRNLGCPPALRGVVRSRDDFLRSAGDPRQETRPREVPSRSGKQDRRELSRDQRIPVPFRPCISILLSRLLTAAPAEKWLCVAYFALFSKVRTQVRFKMHFSCP